VKRQIYIPKFHGFVASCMGYVLLLGGFKVVFLSPKREFPQKENEKMK